MAKTSQKRPQSSGSGAVDNAATDPATDAADIAVPTPRDADPLFVGSLEKGMRVLQAFGALHDTLGLTDIATLTGMGKSAAQRFTHTWEQLGYLEKDPRSRRFRLAPKVIELGYFFLRNDDLVAVAAPHLVALRERCDVAVNLSVRLGADMIYLLRLPSRQLTLSEMLPGRRMPAWCNSAGRMLLAQMSDHDVQALLAVSHIEAYTSRTVTDPVVLAATIRQARMDGYALAEDQVLLNQTGAAVIVKGGTQRPLAAISASAAASDYPAERMVREVVPQLLSAANAIARG
ncbi:IclR family transcriptional regulator C-terminal domain-containing protein [Alcaligenaceae bacterium A4P071]|nr:IclR family transcriptional regulator C-terminal domain-containing protein [Alcaligenaceae bacterium C4P045]MDQ2188114.1 IclR family transcriptional regulator C-terminal domain-containing protein [Alcaligenaceae bacterium A4P071]